MMAVKSDWQLVQYASERLRGQDAVMTEVFAMQTAVDAPRLRVTIHALMKGNSTRRASAEIRHA